MARIIIIGEGQTEQSFCNEILQPYFATKQIYIQNPGQTHLKTFI